MTIKTANGYAWLSSPDVVWTDGKNPRPASNFQNILIALGLEDGVKDHLRWNEFSHRIMIVHPINEPMCSIDWYNAEDEDIGRIRAFLQARELKNVTDADVFKAVMIKAKEHPYHPVRNYLEYIVWDQVPRLNTWLSTCAGAELNPYTTMVGRKFIIGMVKRILEPGCKMDYMIVLEGPQGIMKSTLCRTLVGEDWFSDHIPDLSTKDSQMALSGVWLIEVPELHAFFNSRVESSNLKSYITRREEDFRPPYSKVFVNRPRQCVFAGTTNKEAYLKDETGGRRFWPVKVVERIDLDYMDNIRDQLFAEAVQCVIDGEECFPPFEFEREHIMPQQDARYDEDIWQQRISEVLTMSKNRTTVSSILTNILEVPVAYQRGAEKARVVGILTNLGWVQRRTGKFRYYYPPGALSSDAMTE